jgi:hypothetical protein
MNKNMKIQTLKQIIKEEVSNLVSQTLPKGREIYNNPKVILLDKSLYTSIENSTSSSYQTFEVEIFIDGELFVVNGEFDLDNFDFYNDYDSSVGYGGFHADPNSDSIFTDFEIIGENGVDESYNYDSSLIQTLKNEILEYIKEDIEEKMYDWSPEPNFD